MSDDNVLAGQLSEVHESFIAGLVQAGIMGKLRAQLRLAAVGLLNDDKKALGIVRGSPLAPSALPVKTQIALLLIDEFLTVHDDSYKASQGIFHEESGVEALAGDEILAPVRSALGARVGGSTLLESLVDVVLTKPNALKEQSHDDRDSITPQSSAVVRSQSPDIEAPVLHRAAPTVTTTTTAATTSVPKEASQDPLQSSGKGVAPSSLSRASSIVLDTYEDSIAYSDRSTDSVLDATNCEYVERVTSATDGATTNVVSGGSAALGASKTSTPSSSAERSDADAHHPAEDDYSSDDF